MKARFSLLIGFVLVVAAYAVSAAKGDPLLFRRINEWVFFLAAIAGAIIFITVSGNTPSNNRKKEIQSMYRATNGRFMGSLTSAQRMTPQDADIKKTPEQLKAERRDGYRLLLAVFLITLPSVIAVLVQHYF